MELIFWAALFVFFVIAEFATVQLISVWFAIGSLIAMLCTYFFDKLPFLGQLGIFIASSAIMLAITFPFVRKKLIPSKVATNNDLNIGQSATVIEEINLDNGTGRVTLNGVNWSAVPDNKDTIIPNGTIVTIKNVDGSKLVVEKKQTNTAKNI